MSNTFKGTPGPWSMRPTEAKNADGTALFHDIIAGNQWGTITSTHASKVTGVTAEQDKANAQLISCAPEILEMLKRLNSELIHCLTILQKNGNPHEVDFQTTAEAETLITRATTI